MRPSENAMRARIGRTGRALAGAERKVDTLAASLPPPLMVRAAIAVRWDRSGAQGLLEWPQVAPDRTAHADHTAHDDDGIAWRPLSAPRMPSETDGHRLALFRALFAEYERAGCVIEVRSPYATTLACMPRIQAEGIPAFIDSLALAGGDDLRCARLEPPGSPALAEAVCDALSGRNACLLAHRGLLVLGPDPEEAALLAEELEYVARLYWQALQLGEPATLDAGLMHQAHHAMRR